MIFYKFFVNKVIYYTINIYYKYRNMIESKLNQIIYNLKLDKVILLKINRSYKKKNIIYFFNNIIEIL